MPLPGLTINVLDGNLGLQSPNNSRTMLFLGVCTTGTANQLYQFGDQTTLVNTLGAGKLVDCAANTLAIAGPSVFCMPVNPSVAGGVSSATHTGTGTGTMTLSAAPLQSITINCTTGGALGTAAFTVTLGSGLPSTPILSASSWSSTGFAVPGTFVTLTFAAGTYVGTGTPDQYIVSTLGAVTHPQGAGPSVSLLNASTIDNYAPLITVTTAGAVGTAQITYSLDGTAAATSSAIVTAASYAIPNTGIVLALSGTFVAGDTYAFTTCTKSFASGDLTNALTALETTYLNQGTYAMGTVLGGAVSASAWATQAATLETAALSLFASGVYIRWFTEVPTLGSISATSGAVVVDSTDTDSVVTTAGQGVTAPHVCGCAGDVIFTSALTGLNLRRNNAWAAAARAMSYEASRNIGDVSLGGITGVVSIFRDENATPGLDAARFITTRTIPNYPGLYFTDGHTFALSTSDYAPLTNARVIDRASGIVRANALPLVNSKIPVKADGSGRITEKKAQQIEALVNSPARALLVDASPADAVAVTTQVNRNNNVLATETVILAMSVVPFGYARQVVVNLGLSLTGGLATVVSA